MLHAIGYVLHIPARTLRAVRRHPLFTVVVLLVVLGLAVVGLWQCALYQWRAAQTDLHDERYQQARDRLDYCLIAWPYSPEVRVLAARAARLTGDLDAAERHLNRSLKLHGGATDEAQIEFLLLRVQSGEIDDVAPALIDAVEKGRPEAPLILQTMARAYIIPLRYKPAYACISRWIELRPDDAKGYQWRGWVLERLDNHKGAMADYLKALELDPELVPVRLRVAEMLLEDKQAPDALPHLERLYQQVPDNPQVQARLGACRLLQGRTEEARRLMDAAVVHLPNDPVLIVDLARLDMQAGRAAEAERRLRHVLAADPSDTEALYVLANALQFQGRSEESGAVLSDYEQKRVLVDRINEMLKGVADSPTAKPGDYAEIGRLFFQIGRDKFGVYWSERALERDPANQAAHRALAAHYEKKGDAVQAAAHRRRLRDPAASPEPGGAPKH